jgi:hypothetical protein
MLRRWPPSGERSIRSWNWSAARASDAVREHEAQLRSMAVLDQNARRLDLVRFAMAINSGKLLQPATVQLLKRAAA